MSGAKTRRPAALLLVVAAALTALVAGATQAGAAPTTSGTTTFTLRSPSGGGVSAAVAIVCEGRSLMVLNTQAGDDYARATGTTTCPVPITNVIAQTKLEKWSAPLGRWEVVSYGNYDSKPGRFASSITGDHLCSEMPDYYQAVTYHQVRLNNQYAFGTSFSTFVSC